MYCIPQKFQSILEYVRLTPILVIFLCFILVKEASYRSWHSR